VGFDPTTTGFGGLCSFSAKEEQHPVLTRRRALPSSALAAIYEGTPLSPPVGISSPQIGIAFNEAGFVQYLKNSCNDKTIKERVTFAKKYGFVLDMCDAGPILALKGADRNRVMKSLALLSKFQGRYDHWKAIRAKYDLKWAGETSLDVFNRIVNNSEASYSEMLEWVKSMIHALPPEYANIIRYGTLTGLRASESLASIKLVKSDLANYQNGGMLEHFRYADIFLRRTKKAFISVVTDDLIQIAESCQDVNYEGFRAYLKRRNHESHLKYCRKLFATHLRMNGVEPEIIDLFEGRISKSVFLRHYYRPDFIAEIEKVRACLGKLALSITNE
jgi:hypothetical protein